MSSLRHDITEGSQIVPSKNAGSCRQLSGFSQETSPRIIQYQGKRYNIRLETIYWETLEKMSVQKGCKINELVHNLCQDENCGKNKTAFLRTSATNWLSQSLDRANEQLTLKNTEIGAVLRATSLPALIFSDKQSVSRYNSAFKNWLVENASDIVDYSKIRISFKRSFAVLLQRLKEGNGSVKSERAAILLPGFVFPVSINLVNLSDYGQDGQVFMGILNITYTS